MSDALVEHYTKSFASLYNALQTETPPDFPWRKIMDEMRMKLLAGTDSLTSDDLETERNLEIQTNFFEQLSERTGVSQRRAQGIVQSYLYSEVPEKFSLEDHYVEEVVVFFNNEKEKLLESITLLFVIAQSNDYPDVNKHAVAKDTARYLLENEFEGKILELWQNSLDIESKLKMINESKHNAKVLQNIKASTLEYALSEIASLLDLMFVIYQNTSCLPETLNSIMSKLIEYDFGTLYRNVAAVSAKAHKTITRIVNLSVLLIFEMLLEPYLEHDVPKIYDINQTFTGLSRTEPYHGAICLAWGSFIRKNQGLEKRFVTENINLFMNAGIKCKGFQFLKNVFNRKTAEGFPFNGHETNIHGYRMVMKETLASILPLFNVTNTPYRALEDIVTIIETLVEKSPYEDLSTYNSLCMDFLNKIRSPSANSFKILFHFLKNLFPEKVDYIRILGCLVHDRESADRAYELIESQSSFCFEASKIELEQIMKRLPVSYRHVPSGVNFTLQKESTSSLVNDHYSVARTEIDYNGWDILIRTILNTLNTYEQPFAKPEKRHEPLDATKAFLDVIGKILSFSDTERLKDFEKLIRKAGTQISGDATQGSVLLHMLVMIVKHYSTVSHEKAVLIVSAAIRCIDAIGKLLPQVACHALSQLITNLHLLHVLRTECSLGKYDATLSALDCYHTLAINHPLPISPLYKLLPYFTSNVFATHESWRYQRLEQRWQIAIKCLTIFKQVGYDTFWTDHQVPTAEGIRLLEAFLHDGTLFQSLFSHIGLGGAFIERFVRYDRTEEADLVQELMVQSLLLLEMLLKYRIQHTNVSQTPFEESLLSRLMGKKQTPLITAIFELIDHPYNTYVCIHACKVIALIARLTEQYQPRPPSLVGYLGSEAGALVGRCLYRLRKYGENEELKIALLELISTTVDIQRGLADLFLKGCQDILVNIVVNADRYLLNGLAPIVKNTLTVLQNIFQSGEHGEIVKDLRKNRSFCDSLFHILSTCNNNEELRTDVNVIRSLTAIMTIFSLEMYNFHLLCQAEAKPEESTNVIVEGFSSPDMYSLINEVLICLLSHLTKCFNHNYELVNQITVYISQIHKHSMLKFDSFKVVSPESDKYYDVHKLKRWDTGPAGFIEMVEELNKRLCTIDSWLELKSSIHSLVTVLLLVSKDSGSPISSFQFKSMISGAMTSLVASSRIANRRETNDETAILVPLPPLLDKLLTKHNFTSASFILTTVKGLLLVLETAIPLDTITDIIKMLGTQVQRKKPVVCKELISALMLHYLQPSQQARVSDASVLTPLLTECIKTFGEKHETSRAAISALCFCVNSYYTEEDIRFICNQLTDCLSTFEGQEPGEHVISVLHLLITITNTRAGCNAIIAHNVIQKLTNNQVLSTGVEKFKDKIYVNNEPTSWHTAWCLSLKLLSSIIMNYNAQQSRGQDFQYTRSEITRFFISQCTEFISSHKTRMLYTLRFSWDEKPYTKGALMEAELVSMVMNGLAHTGFLAQNQALLSGVTQALIRCAMLVKTSRLHNQVVALSSVERKLSNKDQFGDKDETNASSGESVTSGSLQESLTTPDSPTTGFHHDMSIVPTAGEGREDMPWSMQLDLSAFSCLRCLLSTVRHLTHLPIHETIENSSTVQVVYDYSNIFELKTVIQILDTCIERLKQLRSATITFAKAANPAGGLTSTGEETDKELEETFATGVGMLCRNIMGSMQESLFVAVSHVMIFQWEGTAANVVTELIGDLTSALDRVTPLLQKLKKQSARLEANTFKKEMKKVLPETLSLFSNVRDKISKKKSVTAASSGGATPATTYSAVDSWYTPKPAKITEDIFDIGK